jgi:hypothetical protein
MVAPLFTVVHIFAFVGMFFFKGLLTADSNFGDGGGRDPYYGLLDFSSYSNSLIIIINLLVVNNWVKMGAALQQATGSLWVYVYFIAFFVIGVTFCLLSLTSIFISSVMVDHDTNPVTKKAAAVSMGAAPPHFAHGHNATVVSRSDDPDSTDFVVSLRHQDADKLFRIIDSVSVRLLLNYTIND